MIFAAIFLEMYPTDCREIFSQALSTSGSTDKKITHLSWNTCYTGDQLVKNCHWPVVCQRSCLRTGRRSACRPHNTI